MSRPRTRPLGAAAAPLALVVGAWWAVAGAAPATAAPAAAVLTAPTVRPAPAAATRTLAEREASLEVTRVAASVALSGVERARGTLLLGATATEVPGADPAGADPASAELARAERAWADATAAVRTLERLVALDRMALDREALDRAALDAAAPPARAAAAGAHPGLLVAAGGDADPRALQAVSFALAQLGDPYRWGATGPDTWDCSSLVQAAYRSAGVALPRTSRQQALVGRRVARADLLPGDLVVLAHDPADLRTVHHVGMYLGDGLWVHAPRTGDVVKVSRVPVAGYAGAVRVVPATTATPPAPPAPTTPTDLPAPTPSPTPTPTPTPDPTPDPAPEPDPTDPGPTDPVAPGSPGSVPSLDDTAGTSVPEGVSP